MMQSVIRMTGFVVMAVFASTAQGQGLDKSVGEKADLFLDICVASSPTFSEAASMATDKGFYPIEDGDGALAHDAGVSLSMQSSDGRCTCYMEIIELERGKLMTAIFDALANDESATPLTSPKDDVFQMSLTRDQQDVDVMLVPVDLGSVPWLAAGSTRSGDCPT